MSYLPFPCALACVAALVLPVASAQELTTNGGFEDGTTDGWVQFVNPPQTFDVTNLAGDGTFAGELFNPTSGTPAVVKQANLGVGVVEPGDMLTVSFLARGVGEVGGVAFAEFFSELDGGGTSNSEILGGGPLPLSAGLLHRQ